MRVNDPRCFQSDRRGFGNRAGLYENFFPNPASFARTIASARSATCSLEKILVMWLRTVLGLGQVWRRFRVWCSPAP